MKEMEKKQECEREFLEKLLQEEEKSELRKKTEGESKEQRTERLIELKVLCQFLSSHCRQWLWAWGEGIILRMLSKTMNFALGMVSISKYRRYY